MRKRNGSNPTRRVVAANLISSDDVERLVRSVRYVGSGHHKRSPADYGLERTNPVPTKSLCDLNGVVTLVEAQSLMLNGIKKKMISGILADGFPNTFGA